MFDASTLEVFIASTNDLAVLRKAVEEVLRDWNSRNGKDRKIILKPIRWEEDATPELGPGSFQAVINERLLDPADILIGIVGKRLGSPTERSISGTVEEIDRFVAARKPVLLYFSDQPFNLSEVDTEELKRVREFETSMQSRGIYLKFKDVPDLKARLRSHLDTLLLDFSPLLIPAGHALAYGYFKNFVNPVHDILKPRKKVVLPDYKIPKRPSKEGDRKPDEEMEDTTLWFSSFRIRIAKPCSLSDATDHAAFSLRDNFLKEINIKMDQSRRAYRVYVPKELHEDLERQLSQRAKPPIKLKLDTLDVIDFPTPLIALQEFVSYKERESGSHKTAALGYFERQKNVQHRAFFDELGAEIKEAGKEGWSIEYFDYENRPDFNLPA